LKRQCFKMPLNPNVEAIHELPLQYRTGIIAEIFQKAKLLLNLQFRQSLSYKPLTVAIPVLTPIYHKLRHSSYVSPETTMKYSGKF